jgi:Holliday junction resolvase
MFVTKRSGEKEEFKKEKIIRTCIRAGVPKWLAKEIADEVERRAYDGIPTQEILQIALGLLEKKLPHIAARYDLKAAIMRLGPAGYEFEKFVARLLEEYGYTTKNHVVLQGGCVKHEIDVVAEKEGKRYMVECKFHNSLGIYTGLKETLYTYARFLDLRDGYRVGKCMKFDFPWLITNTKFSLEAKKYAKCKGILLLGWRYPPGEGIEKLLEKKRLYPISVLRSIDKFCEERLISKKIVFCKDLLTKDISWLEKLTGIKRKRLIELIKEAEKVVSKNV